MPTNPAEQYTIRRQVFRLFGAGLPSLRRTEQRRRLLRAKAFKLREDLHYYRTEAKTDLLMHIAARQIIDFSTNLRRF